uniref:neurofascin isoform X1 n=2 Tax=Oncorhynchus gorbuscha TaxID=8017 RepID=UPI001EAEC76B|nr:neurofascin isoform X1 [Oncorhynchus gorbuscha]XP_046199958.1 neurofascin isoform X1 [Oncorhynchus gorbuscha]XP_046199959.1 neurofascin isoform X1 [Oncorhynchus gorbuscha]
MGMLARSTLLLLLWQGLSAIDVPLEIRQPPTIIKQSLKDHIVDPRDNMVVECEAKGTPHPIFSWRRNGKYFNVARDPQASMRRRSGTLDIYAWADPEAYEGEYQCVATNEYGTAYSNKINLRISRAPLWPREVLEPVTVSVGLPLVLDCSPPPGPPKPETYWMSKCSSGRPFNWPHQPHPPVMLPIKQDRRVSMGVNGDLYFSNVYVNDSATDYCCNARFPYKNIIQQKMPITVRVLTTRMVSEAAPTFLSPAGRSSSQTVLQGEELLLECIAAGVPTPVITWTKDGQELDTTNMKVKNYNKLLQIPKASFEDSGEYTCSATNKIGYLEHTITVRIKAAPFWLEKPSNLVLAPEENARLVCRSDGIPRPSIRWFINGDTMEDATPVPNREVSGDTITFRSVTVANTGVYQCNASNQYGYLFANAYINVLHATPRILRPRTDLVKVIEGRRAWLDCRYFGSPVPDLRWSKYGLGNLEGNRFKVHSNGTLQIKGTRMDDQGTYLCIVSNVAGRDENQVKLEVKESTKILKRPDNMRVLRGTDVRLECKAQHDPTVAVTTTWLKNKQFLIIGWRLSLDESTLVITNVNRGDEGNYTCIIKTEMDKNTASARLVVMDRPDPPTNLQLSDPFERSVRLTWTPGDSNHSPIKENLVQYDDDDWLPFKWRNLSTYPGNLNSVILQLSPFIIYEFRVIAINDIGMSKPSRSSANFQTGGAPPDAIPKNIQGVGTWRNNMMISWEALNNREWNGPHLKYLVWWKRRDSREEWKNATTWWCKYYIYDTDTFTPYEIKVQAVNDFGMGPESPVIIGYSGEDRPTAAPLNLRVSRIEATKVTVHWDPVARSSIMGELKEYKVYFWRDSSQLRWLSVSRAMKSKAFPASGPRLSGVLPGLIPYSNYKMYIVVANNRYEGHPSNTIEFSTPEGTPSAPRSFRIQQRHLDMIWVDWDTPAEPNGIVTGYILKYQTVNATQGEELHVEGFPPNTTSFAVRRYDRYTRYRFTIAAQTRIGVGEWYTEESPHYTTEAYAREQVDLSTQGWVIGVMCAVALFVLILLVVCFIKRSRGGKYPVRDKKEVTLEPVDDKDQEGSFDYRSLERISRVTTIPYSARREEETKVGRGQTTVDTMMKRTDSDDSLVDYGDGQEIEFNEDGSFIGQYTGHKERDDRDTEFSESRSQEAHSPMANSPMSPIYSFA